jgi:hypothetical protein
METKTRKQENKKNERIIASTRALFGEEYLCNANSVESFPITTKAFQEFIYDQYISFDDPNGSRYDHSRERYGEEEMLKGLSNIISPTQLINAKQDYIDYLSKRDMEIFDEPENKAIERGKRLAEELYGSLLLDNENYLRGSEAIFKKMTHGEWILRGEDYKRIDFENEIDIKSFKNFLRRPKEWLKEKVFNIPELISERERKDPNYIFKDSFKDRNLFSKYIHKHKDHDLFFYRHIPTNYSSLQYVQDERRFQKKYLENLFNESNLHGDSSPERVLFLMHNSTDLNFSGFGNVTNKVKEMIGPDIPVPYEVIGFYHDSYNPIYKMLSGKGYKTIDELLACPQ